MPIDFGYSFGIGALLPVPELMPFRRGTPEPRFGKFLVDLNGRRIYSAVMLMHDVNKIL